MIPRYRVPELFVFEDQYKFDTFLKVEKELVKIWEAVGEIPLGTSDILESCVHQTNLNRISELEEIYKHDVLAFVSSVTEKLPNNLGRFFHFGVTSSDITDFALMIQIRNFLNYLISEYIYMISLIYKKALEHKYTFYVGRTHGQYAEPMSLGVKLLGHYCEFERRLNDLLDFKENMTITGAVGNYTVISPQIEETLANRFGFKVEPISTQVLPRDRLAKLMGHISLYGAAFVVAMWGSVRNHFQKDKRDLQQCPTKRIL